MTDVADVMARILIQRSFDIDNRKAPLEGIPLVGLKEYIKNHKNSVEEQDGSVRCVYCGCVGGYADCASGGDWTPYNDGSWSCFECSDMEIKPSLVKAVVPSQGCGGGGGGGF